MKNKKLIDGIIVTPLKQIIDEKGAVFHVMKNNSIGFNGFEEVYISKVKHNIIKGWKFHKKMKQNFCAPYGKLKLVLFDNRNGSKTKGLINEFILDDSNNYQRITIDSEIWYSFSCLSEDYCLLLNISNLIHDPSESLSLDISSKKIPYNWLKKNYVQ